MLLVLLLQWGNWYAILRLGTKFFCLLNANQQASWTGFAKSGAYAEYAVTRADTLAHKPKNITHQPSGFDTLSGINGIPSVNAPRTY